MTRQEGNEGRGRLPGSWNGSVAPTALKMAASWERARRGHWSIIFIAGSAVIRSALEKNEITLSACEGRTSQWARTEGSKIIGKLVPF